MRDEAKECLRERLIRRRVSSEQIIETEEINGREMGRCTSATQTNADTQNTIRQRNKQKVQSQEKGSKSKQQMQFKAKTATVPKKTLMEDQKSTAY